MIGRAPVPAGHAAKVTGVSKLVRSVRGLPGLVGVAVPAAVAAHCLGYELAFRFGQLAGPVGTGTSTGAGHGVHGAHAGEAASVHAAHLPLIPLTSGALLLAATAMLTMVVTVRRVTDIPRVGLGRLIAAQFAVVGMIELAGWMADGSHTAAGLLMALVIQVPVAVVVFHLCRQVRRIVVHLVRSAGARQLTAAPPVAGVAPMDIRPSPLVWALSCPQRGPPAFAAL
jgi:hypothetical protein